MNKKLLIAAVGAAFAVPMAVVHADTALYGHFHASMDNLNNGNAKYGYVASDSSRFGIKGSDDLGGGMKAIYQMESGAFALDSGVGSTANGLGNQLRNTYVGFSGSSWGAVKIGRYDTPFKDLGRKLDNFNEEIGDMRNLLSGSTSVASLYDDRVSNMIRYESPDMGGVTVTALHTSNNNNTGAADSSTNTGEGPTGTGKALNSLGVNWSSGPIFVGGAWQKDSFNKGGAVTKEHDSALRLAGSYTMSDLTVGLIYQDLKSIYGADLDQKAKGVMASYKMANNLFKFHYLTADDESGTACGTSCASTGGKLWALGVDHLFSKATMAYVNYATATNDSNTLGYSVMSGNAGHGENQNAVTKGAKVKGLTAGMVVNF